MYGYDKYAPLEDTEILKRATEEEIFGIVIQDEIVEGRGFKYKAPYRTDNVGDCYFERYDGVLRFIDFASPYMFKSMDCFEFIKRTYNVGYFEALKIINEELGLGLGDNLGKVKNVIHECGNVEEKNVKKVIKERVITILPRQFNYKDKQFWSKYEITKQNLIDDGVIPIELYQSVSRKGKYFSIRPFDICYAYTEFENNKKKIYRPNAANKEAKWFTNCSQNDIGGIKHLPVKGDKLVITKSYKDYRVLKNMGIKNVIWFQNEGMIPSKKILKDLLKRFKEIIIWFDNDNAGISNGRIVVGYLKSLSNNNIVRSVILPPKLLQQFGIKDPSDYISDKGRDALLEFIIKHNLN